MVDRIVPAATAADRDTASRLIGARDEATVVGEPFSQWVIEDAFRGRRPAWEAAGALLVPDTRPYEAMKLRLLNGGHSALAYLGLLRGHETVADGVADPELSAFLERLWSEVAPTLDPVPGIDLARYRADLLTRWSNPRIAHRLEQIATGGASKLPPRLLAPARELLAAGQEPAAICLVVAAWLRRLEAAATAGRSRREVAAAVAGAGSPAAAAERALGVGRCSARTCASPRCSASCSPTGSPADFRPERPSSDAPAKKKNHTSNAAMARMTAPTTT